MGDLLFNRSKGQIDGSNEVINKRFRHLKYWTYFHVRAIQ